MSEILCFVIGLMVGILLVCSGPEVCFIKTDKSTNINYTYYNKTVYKLVPIKFIDK
mgnify:CR=1 FL=1